MFSRLLVAAFVLVPFAVACSASSEDGTTGDDQNVTARPGEVGGMCGGIAGIPCKPGLTCKHAGNFPDASGTCEAAVTCMAVPACDPGDTAVTGTCASGETCYTHSMCGRSVTCKKSVDVTLEGTLFRSFGIGGENTGSSIKTSSGVLELVLEPADHDKFVDGRFARAKGKRTTLSGVETHNRPALDVTDLLVCPAPGSSINCMPPVAPGNTVCGADRSWIQEKCTGVSYLD